MPLERSYAQKQRPDRRAQGVSWMSRAKRIAFWASVQAGQKEEVAQNIDAFTSTPPVAEVQLAGANVRQATLESVAPNLPGQGTGVAGIGESGFVPPPPTGVG